MFHTYPHVWIVDPVRATDGHSVLPRQRTTRVSDASRANPGGALGRRIFERDQRETQLETSVKTSMFMSFMSLSCVLVSMFLSPEPLAKRRIFDHLCLFFSCSMH